MDHNMVLSCGKQMYLRRGPFRLPWRCANAIRSASPDAAWPGLYQKPLDAAIGQLLAPYRPGGRQGDNHYEHVPTLLAISMAIAMRRCYTPRIARWRRFVAFIKATKRHHRTSTRSDSVNRSSQCCYFRDISSSNRWKRARVALITIGVWHIKLMRSTLIICQNTLLGG